MRYAAIDYYPNGQDVKVEGYLRIPENFTGNWMGGFITYLEDKYHCSNISIYPWNVHTNECIESMTKGIEGRKNLEDDFNLALRSKKYYPPDNETADYTKRCWSKMSPLSQEFVSRGR